MVGLRTLAVAFAAAGLLVAAPGAHAQPMLVVDGAGDGHGVGMSQVGAEGFAQHGYSYAQILSHYYPGTAIGTLPGSPTIRVLLAGARSSVLFAGASVVGGRQLSSAV